jgi:hypothetical protein
MKTQLVRIADVIFFGPFMLYAASRPKLNKSQKLILTTIGVGTIVYNAINYLKYETKKTA